MRRFAICLVAGAAVLGVAGAFAGTPVKVIFDTDMLTDFDDVGALACLHALADAGECEILATVSCTRGNASVGAVQIINSYYGRGNLPVGVPKGIGVLGAHVGATAKVDPRAPLGAKGGSDGGHYKYRKLLADYPGWYAFADSDDAPDANDVYRKALAAAPDRSVVICSVGFLTNLRRLLETPPDAVSPLDGKALVAKKVKKWVAMACCYPQGREYNSQNDAASSRIALENWPTPIVFSDWQYGCDLFAGRAIAEMAGPRNPVRDVFAGNIPARAEIRKDPAKWQRSCFGMGGRAAWDETAVLAAVRGEHSYFNVHRGTYRMVGDKGDNVWIPDEENGRHLRLTERVNKNEVGKVIDELICRPPRLKGASRLCVTASACAEFPVTWNLARLNAPPQTFPSEYPATNGVSTLFYEGEPYKGKPTRVFAYLAVPKVSAGRKVPGMVLVHGGGGSAFRRWAKYWCDRGYAAISMDTCGCVSGNEFGSEQRNHRRHAWAGPAGWGGYALSERPPDEQWMYHAVAAVIRGHSLLRALPQVDADRIGITGVSWGGILTCIVASVDPRFSFAVPVYGCGFLGAAGALASKESKGVSAAQRQRWLALFDPSRYLPAARMPFLWVDGSNDFAFPLPSLQKSVELTRGPHYRATRVRMGHAHGKVSEEVREIDAFADFCVGRGVRRTYPRVTDSCGERGLVTAVCDPGRDRIVRAELNVTTDRGEWMKRSWKILPMTCEGAFARAPLPPSVTAWYVNFFTADGICVSGELSVPSP